MRTVEVEGARLSVIGLGTWQFGSGEWGYGREYAGRTAPEIVSRALELGINFVDTAEIYGFGRSERILGGALRGRRGSVFVATKLMPVLPVPSIMRRRAEGSARRLGIDRIDLYQLHWPNPVVPIRTQMRGMRQLLDGGGVAHAGVSNYSLAGWLAAEDALGRPVLSNQVRYNLAHMDPGGDLVPYAGEYGRLVIAYSPLAQGLLSGRYSPDRRPRDRLRQMSRLFTDARLVRAQKLASELADVGRPYGATASQVALAWVVRRPNVVAIPGASSVRQLEENAAAGDLVLDDDDDERLRAAGAAFWA